MTTFRILGPDEGDLLNSVAEDVFDGPVIDRWCAEFMADPRHHLAVAVDQGVVVGMASGVHYVHPDKPPELWINEVGVAPSHQGRGIGGLLMETLLARGRALGCAQAWVLTETSNASARRLYERAGGRVEPDGPVMYTFDIPA